jgi:uncharacterized membrane protein YkvA (DUF1232 family)
VTEQKQNASQEKMKTTLDGATRRAESLIKNPRKRNKLLDAAGKVASSGKYALQLSGITEKTKTLIRMVRSTANREYLDTPWQTIVLISAALIYFVSPFDALADFLPLIGFVDDAAIITALFASISKDVEKFTAWETTKAAPDTAIINSAEPE